MFVIGGSLVDTKDWILLFVPIIVNGVLLFVFQKAISAKFDRQAKKSDLSLSVLAGFRDHIIAAIVAMNNLQSAANQGGDGSDEMSAYVDKIQELCKYYFAYKTVLSNYENEIVELVDSLNICINIINNRKGKFKQEEINSLIQHLNGNNEILQQLSKKCFDLTV